MNFRLLFTLLLSNYCLGGLIPITKFSSLNDDVLHILCNELDLAELFNMAETDVRLNNIAKSAYHRRFRDHQVAVVRIDDRHDKFRVSDKSIEIREFKTAKKILQHFGSSIRNLYVANFNLDEWYSAEINKLISERVSGSVKYLDLGVIKPDTLEQFIAPFKNVEELTASIRTNSISRHIKPFDELFPQLKKLTLTLRLNLDYKFLDCKLPQLDNIDITINTPEITKQLEGFFQKNNQIRTLNVHSFPAGYAKDISKLLPNLETLTVNQFDIGNEPVHMTSVKHFTLMPSAVSSINHLTFASLDSIEMSYQDDFFGEWMTFFGNNPNVTKLTFTSTNRMDGNRFMGIIDEIPNLVELNLDTYETISVDSIKDIVRSHAKLVKIKFPTAEFSEEDMEDLQKFFEHRWSTQGEKKDKSLALEADLS